MLVCSCDFDEEHIIVYKFVDKPFSLSAPAGCLSSPASAPGISSF